MHAILRLALVPALALLVPAVARAEPQRDGGVPMRGTVVSRDQDLLTVKPDAAPEIVMRMDAKTKVLMIQSSTVRDIKPESYLSVVSVPDGSTRKAIGVTLHSPSERGLFAGSRTWNLAPDSRFTSGWIESLSAGEPRRVSLRTSRTGQPDASFVIGGSTPTTQITPGEKALLVEGAPVAVFSGMDADGKPLVELVAVGRQGTQPTF